AGEPDRAGGVEVVHEVAAAGERGDGPATPERLAERAQVGCHTVVLLRTAEPGAEPGQHLVEDEDDTAPCRLNAEVTQPVRIGGGAAPAVGRPPPGGGRDLGAP